MRRKDSQEYLVLITVVNKVHRHMGAVAVKDQEAPLPPCLSLGEAIKHLLKPGKAYIVVGPASGR